MEQQSLPSQSCYSNGWKQTVSQIMKSIRCMMTNYEYVLKEKAFQRTELWGMLL